MESRFNQLLSDRWNNILIYLCAYIYLIMFILGFHSATGEILAIVSGLLILIFIIRVIILLIRPMAKNTNFKNSSDSVVEKVSIGMKIKRGDINSSVGLVGYMILLGVILGPECEELWIIYGFIALGCLSAIARLLGNNKRGLGI